MLILYSGGLDSTVLLYEYQKDIKLALSFNYGSKHNDIEFEYAKRNLEKINIPYIRIPLDFVNEHFESDLLKSGNDVPEGHYEDESMKRTIVPFRNGIMLSIAAGIADSKNLSKILIANHWGDNAIYPDCRKTFIDNMNSAIQSGTDKDIQILAPYLGISKKDIALKGKELGVDFNETYTCYRGNIIHCGRCGSCTERQEALEGFDTTIYQEEKC